MDALVAAEVQSNVSGGLLRRDRRKIRQIPRLDNVIGYRRKLRLIAALPEVGLNSAQRTP